MTNSNINYNEGYRYLIGNKLYNENKCRYFEPNMEENNCSIIDSISDNYIIVVLKEKHNDFLLFQEKKKQKILENKDGSYMNNSEEYVKNYKYEIDLVEDLNFEKCDIVYVGQTLSNSKYNSSNYEFLSKYNIKNIKTLDAQLFYIFL